jgi:hypothetical protein
MLIRNRKRPQFTIEAISNRRKGNVVAWNPSPPPPSPRGFFRTSSHVQSQPCAHQCAIYSVYVRFRVLIDGAGGQFGQSVRFRKWRLELKEAEIMV